MDLWELPTSRPLSWTPELESVFAIYCRKFAFDFSKVSAAMTRYVAMSGNSSTVRLVDPFHFTPDVCRVHWSYRDYLVSFYWNWHIHATYSFTFEILETPSFRVHTSEPFSCGSNPCISLIIISFNEAVSSGAGHKGIIGMENW